MKIANIKTSKKNIQDIVVGDVVLSKDLINDNIVIKKITNIFRPIIKSENQVEIKLKRDVLITSKNHKMWAKSDNGWNWEEAELLSNGDCLLGNDNNTKKIISVEFNGQLDEIFYDLEVEDTHNYFAGDTEYYLSHNSATVNFAWFHHDIMDILVLKNNSGTDDNRVRKLDYCIGLDKLICDRFIKNQDVTLFSYHETPQLWNNFGLPEFEELYLKAEQNKNLKFKKKIPARELIGLLAKERLETGRIYTLFVDHANEHGSWTEHVDTTNLCCEVVHRLTPIKDLNDPDGEIGVCILSALNLLELKDSEETKNVCDVIVRMLDALIDHQNYFVPAAENFAKKRRSLGIGITNLAALLAQENIKYWDTNAPNFVAKKIEEISYYLISSSVDLAKEMGTCEKFDKTKYSKGILPIDTYKKSIDDFVTEKLHMDWDSLRDRIKKYGMRHSTLMCQMPIESSSVIQSSTNGMEPPRSPISFKGSKANILPVVIPNIDKYKNNYTYAFDMPSNDGYLRVVAAIQKFMDMSLSTNTYYVPSRYENNKVPLETAIKDILTAYKYGIKSLYYANTDDGDQQSAMNDGKEIKIEEDNSGCVGGACTL